MTGLFQMRIGASVVGDGPYYQATWPLGRITLFEDHLAIGLLLTSFEFPYAKIDSIARIWFGVRIVHRVEDIPSHVRLDGFRICRRLEAAIKKHNLPIRICR